VSDSHQLKKCSLCGDVKKESYFRYIKYFEKRRTICKRCEARERQKKRRLVEKHVREHGITPGIRTRLETEVAQLARQQATETVLSNLSPEHRKRYRWAQWISQICVMVLLLSILFGLLGLIRGFFDWLALLLLTGVIAVAGKRYFNRHYTDPVDSEISRHLRSIHPILYKEQLRERIEYERFYTSPEWKILRLSFLRGKKINGYYVCEYCQETIWPFDVTVDHFKPKSKFPHLAVEMTNLRVAHRRCNSSKGDTIIGEE
jgi:5-methylcytosine-specific restriction endonuclease McrA